MVTHAFTVDVEDWFHLLDCPQMPKPENYWRYEQRVVKNTDYILTVLDEYSVHATFFVLGWVAEHYPMLVRRIADAGHEIGVHGYAHVLAESLSDKELEDDTRRAVEAVTKAAGAVPVGYRSAGGSLLERHRWIFSLLVELGIQFDSSVYPRPGGLAESEGYPTEPYIIYKTADSSFWEFPSTMKRCMGIQWAFAEGGFLRLLPLFLAKRWFKERTDMGLPVACCLHPREFDPGHPSMNLSMCRQWKTHVGLKGMEGKVRALLDSFEFKPMGVALKEYIQVIGHTDRLRL